MINWAIRYQPIVRELALHRGIRALEVGSGPEGLAMFWRGSVTSIDRDFKRPPIASAVQASAFALPFPDRAWRAVVSSDMLEHIEPLMRRHAVQEMTRVCDELLLLAFPSGAAADCCFRKMAGNKTNVPLWLAEHIRYGLPDAGEITEWLRAEGWQVRVAWHEPVALQQWLWQLEFVLHLNVITYAAMRIAGPWFAQHLPVPNDSPSLRVLLKAERIKAHSGSLV